MSVLTKYSGMTESEFVRLVETRLHPRSHKVSIVLESEFADELMSRIYTWTETRIRLEELKTAIGFLKGRTK